MNFKKAMQGWANAKHLEGLNLTAREIVNLSKDRWFAYWGLYYCPASDIDTSSYDEWVSCVNLALSYPER